MARVEVAAEATGKVWKIETSVGATVATDDVLVIVESMKMEIPVTATRGGRVAEIRVAEGDAVDEGQVVAVIET